MSEKSTATHSTDEVDVRELGNTLLRIGSHLMSCGANTRRIRMTIERVSEAFNCSTELLIMHRALMLTISDEKDEQFHSSLKRTSPHGVNFRIVSGISKMSWKVVQQGWSVEQINAELNRLLSLSHYPRIVTLLMVGLADASFCRLFGGDYKDMLVAFAATFVGLFFRQEATKRSFNPYLCIFLASLVSSLIAGAYVSFGNNVQEYALSASILYLIPGVPLINSFSDFIHGNIMNGIVRSVNGLIIAFAIAFGLLLAIQMWHL
ncbi:MAG: threonine/serine exporter family protein [Myxococcales bacterium]|nr:MAG: threonine/serine exporter family protein [Myxococcales bacterium]